MSNDQRLRHRLHELEAREVKHVKLQESFADLERTVLQWKNAHNTLSTEHANVRAELEELKALQTKQDAQLKASEALAAQWQKKHEKAFNNAKYDQIAREVQAKKLLIAEHELAAHRGDVARLQALVANMDTKTATLQHSWLDERALRLQDLHRHDALAAAARAAAAAAQQAEDRELTAQRYAAAAEEHCAAAARRAAAQERIEAEQAAELSRAAAEIEGLQLQLMATRTTLLDSRAAHRATELEHKWVRGGGAPTAPATSQHSAFGQHSVDSATAGASPCGSTTRRQRSKQQQLMLTSSSSTVSKLSATVGCTRADALPLHADPALATLVYGAAAAASSSSSPKRNTVHKSSSLSASSTLSVPGSLWVSGGLNVRKEPVDVGRGSAKEALRAALERMQCMQSSSSVLSDRAHSLSAA